MFGSVLAQNQTRVFTRVENNLIVIDTNPMRATSAMEIAGAMMLPLMGDPMFDAPYYVPQTFHSDIPTIYKQKGSGSHCRHKLCTVEIWTPRLDARGQVGNLIISGQVYLVGRVEAVTEAMCCQLRHAMSIQQLSLALFADEYIALSPFSIPVTDHQPE